MIVELDPELRSWIYGIVEGEPTRAGDFLYSLAKTAVRADSENYVLLRPVLLVLKMKYPNYCFMHERPTGRAMDPETIRVLDRRHLAVLLAAARKVMMESEHAGTYTLLWEAIGILSDLLEKVSL